VFPTRGYRIRNRNVRTRTTTHLRAIYTYYTGAGLGFGDTVRRAQTPPSTLPLNMQRHFRWAAGVTVGPSGFSTSLSLAVEFHSSCMHGDGAELNRSRLLAIATGAGHREQIVSWFKERPGDAHRDG